MYSHSAATSDHNLLSLEGNYSSLFDTKTGKLTKYLHCFYQIETSEPLNLKLGVAVFLQVTRGHRAGAQINDVVYYNVERGNVELLYCNIDYTDAEAAAARREEEEEKEEDHLYDEVGQQGASEAGPSGEETPYQRIDLQDVTVYNRVGAEGTEYHHYEEIPEGARVETEHHHYEEVDLQRTARRGRRPPVYEVDL